MEKVETPGFRVLYNKKEITEDISQYILQFTYRDKVEGESDELQIQLEDADGNWSGPWYPGKGDSLEAYMIKNDVETYCGAFEIDEIELSGPPDTVTISALATGIKGALRTRNSKAYEKQTLKQIAQAVASKNGFTLLGEIENIQVGRVTQNRETDLGFLSRIANDYGHIFSVRDKQLIFFNRITIEGGKPVFAIDKTEIARYSLTDKTRESYSKAKVVSHSPQKKEVVNYTVEEKKNADGDKYTQITKGDTLVIHSRTENKQQAEAKAKAALYKSISLQQSGSITIEMNPLAVSGNNFEFTGMGELTGKYHICESEHALTRGGGGTSSLEIKRVGYLEEIKKKPKKKPREVSYRVVQ